MPIAFNSIKANDIMFEIEAYNFNTNPIQSESFLKDAICKGINGIISRSSHKKPQGARKLNIVNNKNNNNNINNISINLNNKLNNVSGTEKSIAQYKFESQCIFNDNMNPINSNQNNIKYDPFEFISMQEYSIMYNEM